MGARDDDEKACTTYLLIIDEGELRFNVSSCSPGDSTFLNRFSSARQRGRRVRYLVTPAVESPQAAIGWFQLEAGDSYQHTTESILEDIPDCAAVSPEHGRADGT